MQLGQGEWRPQQHPHQCPGGYAGRGYGFYGLMLNCVVNYVKNNQQILKTTQISIKPDCYSFNFYPEKLDWNSNCQWKLWVNTLHSIKNSLKLLLNHPFIKIWYLDKYPTGFNGSNALFYSNCRLGARITHYSMHIPIKMRFTTRESNFKTKKRTRNIHWGNLFSVFFTLISVYLLQEKSNQDWYLILSLQPSPAVIFHFTK